MTEPAVAHALEVLNQVEADLREAASLHYMGRAATTTLTHAAAAYGAAQVEYLRVLNDN